MCIEDNCNRKDMDDFKRDVVDTANTSGEIVEDSFQDVKTETKSTVDTVEENIKSAVEKVQDTAADIKEGSIEVARSVKRTAINVARTITTSNEKDK